MTMSPVRCALLLPFALACSGGQPDRPVVDNAELAQLYEADQADRSGGGDMDWAAISERDSLRRERVTAMLGAGEVRTSEDYRHAAMIFQHGPDTTAPRLAHELAQRAVEIDSTNARAKWLMAAAWDRYLMRRGEPQWYGTQFVKDSATAPWILYDVDTTRVTDADRAALGVPALAEARARVAAMNAGNED